MGPPLARMLMFLLLLLSVAAEVSVVVVTSSVEYQHSLVEGGDSIDREQEVC